VGICCIFSFGRCFWHLPAHKIAVNQTGVYYFSQACSEDVFISFRDKLIIPIERKKERKTIKAAKSSSSYRFISELMNIFCMAGGHQQPEQSNYLAEGQSFNL